MDSEDGEVYIKNLANYVHTNEKALANANNPRRNTIARHSVSHSLSAAAIQRSPTLPTRPSTSAASSPFSPSFSLSLGFGSSSSKSTKLSLTPHHLFYLLSRFEELGIDVGPMKIRLENIQDTSNASNYVSFLSNSQRSHNRGSDVGSIRSVSSIRSVMSSVTSMWSNFGFGASISAARTERHKALIHTELKYLYSSFTKIPALRLAPDWRARLVRGYEEFPFDSAVPLHAFKNVQSLEIEDIDFRQFFGWDRMADQIKSLSLRRACIEDPADILIDIVLDDMDKRRRRTAKNQHSPPSTWTGSTSPRRSPTLGNTELPRLTSPPGSPDPRRSGNDLRIGALNIHESAIYEPPATILSPDSARGHRNRGTSMSQHDDGHSPTRSHHPSGSRHQRESSMSQARGSAKIRRSGSGSSHSSLSDSFHQQAPVRSNGHQRRGSSSNLLNIASTSANVLSVTKWRFLRHLCLADNAITAIPNPSLTPLANTLHSLDLGSNLFTQIPDSLATLTALRALNLAHCMIDSLQSLTRNPLPAISSLNLRANRLQSLSGIERLLPLERLDLRDNRLTDPVELARLTGIPYIREIWVDGNPFTRTHKDYRITIFNLFRKTPGYTEDLLIDGSGPSYSEKRYLVDRVPVPAAVPVVRPSAPEVPAIDIGIGSTSPANRPLMAHEQAPRVPREPTVLRKECPQPRAMNAERSSRRRKGPKRRIVDLSTSEPSRYPPPPSIITSDMVPPPIPQQHSQVAQYQTLELPQLPRKKPSMTINTNVGSVSVSTTHAAPVEDTATLTVSRSDLAHHRISQSSDVSPPEPASPPLEAQTQTLQVIPAGDSCDVSSPVMASESEMSPLYSPGAGVGAPWDVGAELYRRKIEALRNEIGEGYLTVLGENSWIPNSSAQFPVPDYSSATTASTVHHPHSRPPTATAGQSAVVSGRTIG